MNEILPTAAAETVVVCGAEAACCICDEPPGHTTTPHTCKCGGKWVGTIDQPDFDVVAWPVAVPS